MSKAIISMNYIPKSYGSDIISNSLLDINEQYDGYSFTSSVLIVENMEKGIRVLPEPYDVFEFKRCNRNELFDIINESIALGYNYMIINDFDITIDEVKETLMNMIKDTDISLYINNTVDFDTNGKLTAEFDDEILTMDESEWKEVKRDIEERKNNLNKNSNELSKEQKKELFKLFNVEELSDIENIEEDEKLLLNESYSHTIDNSCLTIFLKENAIIIGNDNLEFVEISQKHWNFLIDIIKNNYKIV